MSRTSLSGVTPWWAVCVLLALPAMLLAPVHLAFPPEFWAELPRHLVMRPDAGLNQPIWSWWTTVWLHGSEAHLMRNLAGLALLLLLGWLIRPGAANAVAWLLAWPLTQLGMVMEPELSSYVGLSGVLHAGVVVLALHTLTAAERARNGVVGVLLLGWLAGKLIMENPWAHSLVLSSTSAINVAPWAHLSGSVAGALAWALVHVTWPASRQTGLPPV